MHLRDVDNRVLAVLAVTETLRHARRQTAVINATQSARGVFPGGWAERRLRESDHHSEVGVVTYEIVSGESDRERCIQLVRDVCLDDESLEPADVLRLRNPAAGECRELVHVRGGQGQTRVNVGVIESSHHIHVDGRVEKGVSWKRQNYNK